MGIEVLMKVYVVSRRFRGDEFHQHYFRASRFQLSRTNEIQVLKTLGLERGADTRVEAAEL